MDQVCVVEGEVTYGEVDRAHGLALAALVQRLQEAAIRHADQAGLGLRAMAERGESWVLNRFALQVRRYPGYGERLRVETWSRGIRGFRGWREFRVWCGDELVAEASTLWLYVALGSRSLLRVPAGVAETYPRCDDATALQGALDEEVPPPAEGGAAVWRGTLRHGDVDGNGHVNHAVVFACLQTAVAAQGGPARVGQVQVRFAREIPADATELWVRLGQGAEAGRFSCGTDGQPAVTGAWRA